MGIFGLLTFLRKDCDNGFQKVYLEEIATQYKNQTGKDPVMLVDASSALRFLGRNMGKNDKNVTLLALQENLGTFINKCYKMGIKLKFIGEGLKPREKYEIWCSRTIAKYERENKFLSNVIIGEILSTAEIIYLENDKCEFIRSIHEADDYIMRYAKMEGCFAILSNDSDLVIAEGCHYFLCEPELQLKSMSTYNYNRNSLAEFLGLKQSLLPVFASLCDTQLSGNAYRSRTRKVCLNPEDVAGRFRNCAELIKKCPFQEDIDEMLNYITEKMTPEEANDVKKKFRFYSAAEEEEGFLPTEDTHWNDILLAAERRHVTNVSDRAVLELLRERVAFLSPKYNVRAKFSIVSRLKPLREKIYGILFSECPDNEVFIKEYTVINEGKFSKPVIKPVLEDVRFESRSHSGLLKLWSQDNSKETMYERRLLFCQAVDENLTPAFLDELDIPEELLFPVLAMFYIRRHAESKNAEIERKILLSLTVLAHKIRKWRRATTFPFEVVSAELEMSEPFLTTIEHFKLLNSVCGNPFSRVKTAVFNYYDADLFNFVYRQVVDGKKLPTFLRVDTSAELRNLKEKLEKVESTCAGRICTAVELASAATG